MVRPRPRNSASSFQNSRRETGSTPYLDEAERCARVALLHDGHLLALDEPSRLQNALAGQILEVITGTERPAVDALRRVTGVLDVQSFGDRAHARVAPGMAQSAVPAIESAMQAANVPLVSVRPIAASLEDVFIELITGGRR